jgi:hypothetical protein
VDWDDVILATSQLKLERSVLFNEIELYSTTIMSWTLRLGLGISEVKAGAVQSADESMSQMLRPRWFAMDAQEGDLRIPFS